MKIKMNDIMYVKKTGNKFRVSWKMTEWCNYRCPYCYMKKAVSSKNTIPFERILEIAEHIDPIIEKQANGRKTFIHLIGGEVCYYDLIQVFEKIKSPLNNAIIATNFSQSLDYWKNLKNYLNDRHTRANIIASFHLGQCDENEFVEKAIALNAHVKCVVNSENISLYKPYFERLKGYCIIEPTVERDNINSCEQLTGEDLIYLDQLNSEMNKKNSPYFEVTMRDGTVHNFGTNIEFINSIDVGGFDPDGFMCTAGLDGIRIAPDGSLRRAGCRHASVSQNRLGFITDEDILVKLPTEPWICKTIEAGKDGILVHKMCTCFSNATMWRA